ncbi:GlsB/YeaQ/YmgE family stress response membrane protein [Asticcacaulis sp. YBE204]|uniref:GlsB/YeaQ/YmgE family stress response membrane protein n=1 Tax=Asticcacaulis sp. YBE204 TaxID=1282363 RepID=UPI0003C4082B|nr:GlsB/YeaQ/YmgE family stress response membrane protein [Asticcacaulis sp. YBE204]ESQ79140.1 membrane protein [Asticcacaulis sp. YBE204]
MQENQIGWLAALIVGAFAGWIAEQLMKSEQGLFMNIILGVIGAALASALFSVIGVSFGGWFGYLIAGTIGACLLIALSRMFRGRKHS